MTQPHEESRGEGWAERYEQLRQHALGGPAPTAGWFFGLDALLQNGLAAWMRTVPTKGARQEESETACTTGGWLAIHQRETTWVLAEMTLPQLWK